jgi:hypothetical protein
MSWLQKVKPHKPNDKPARKVDAIALSVLAARSPMKRVALLPAQVLRAPDQSFAGYFLCDFSTALL